ncbi:MAG: putative spermidine/putrescine transport system permease protein [Roseivirga sp.]|jgi:putative spermidine/putrescine transport system permease protein
MQSRFKPFISLLILALALPFFLLPLLSLVTQYRFPQLWPEQFTTQHWVDLFGLQSGLSESAITSTILALSVAAFVTVLGFITSRHVAYHPKKEKLLLLAYLPFILSPVIFGAFLLYYFIAIGLAGKLIGVVIAQVILLYPFSVILFSSFWDQRLKSFEDLTATLGGSQYQTFTRVLLPVSKNIILLCFFQTFLLSWFEYGLTSVIGIGKVETLTMEVFFYVGEANVYFAALASCLLILPPVLLLYINKRFVFR